jgi:protein TonB
VQEAAVVQAAPEGHFEGVAVAAFQTARFAPAQKDGRSVRSRVLVRVSFDPVGLKQSNPSPRRHEDTKKDDTWE